MLGAGENEAGYRGCDTPFDGWHGHLDGLWNGATRVAGPEPRLMAYARITALSRPSTLRRVNPAALCDIWQEWPGMTATVAAERWRPERPERNCGKRA